MKVNSIALGLCFCLNLMARVDAKAVPRDITFYGIDQDVKWQKMAVVSIEMDNGPNRGLRRFVWAISRP
jgi:hypothetical protein